LNAKSIFPIQFIESAIRSQNKKNSPNHQIPQKADKQQNKFDEFW
jgi:hypothetical protein